MARRYPSIVASLICLIFPAPMSTVFGAEATADLPVRVFYTTNTLEGAVPAQPIQTSTEAAGANTPATGGITVDSTKTFQTMAGIGAAFSEIGSLAYVGLPKASQDALAHSLFDAKDGAGLSMCRLPIGASDFAASAYSYDDTPEDYQMKAFTLERDEKSIIPFVLAARQVNPDLKLHASPWSPPAWMKKSGKMDRGGKDSRLRDEDAIYAAYALYFERYLTGYLAHGIPIARLLPQNEMDCNPGYPGNVMEPADTIRLVTQHLAPRFKASKIATEIWAGTFREKPKAAWATECMKNEAFRASIAGLGIQYFDGHSIEALTKEYPSLRYMHTEASCENGKNVADQAARRFPEMIGVFNSNCDTYSYWNMVLDEKQKSGWGWAQNSLVTINRGSGEVRYNPDFQPVCLVSRFVRPGAVRISAASRNSGPVSAFRGSDGTMVILAQNRKAETVVLELQVDGRKAKVALPANADCVLLAQ